MCGASAIDVPTTDDRWKDGDETCFSGQLMMRRVKVKTYSWTTAMKMSGEESLRALMLGDDLEKEVSDWT